MNNKTPIEQPTLNIPRQATTPGYRHHRLVPMLRHHEDKELILPMVMLTARENSEVEAKSYAETLRFFDGKVPKEDEMGAQSWKDLFESQKQTLILLYSVRVPNDLTKRWFLDKKQIEEEYSIEEIGIMGQNYISIVLTQPHLTTVDFSQPNAFQAMIDTN